MKTKKVILIVLGIVFLTGCSIDESDDSLVLEKDLLEIEGAKLEFADPVDTLGDIIIDDDDDENEELELNICPITIQWNSGFTSQERESVRSFFESSYGKSEHELGISFFEEVWYFDLNHFNQLYPTIPPYTSCAEFIAVVKMQMSAFPSLQETVVTTTPNCQQTTTVIFNRNLNEFARENIRERFEQDFGKVSEEIVLGDDRETWAFNLEKANENNPGRNFLSCDSIIDIVQMEVDGEEGVETDTGGKTPKKN